MRNDIELLAPAGDLEKWKTAIDYGADAVYFGGAGFSLRATDSDLSLEEMAEGLAYTHERGKKAYLAVNIYPHQKEMEALREYLHQVGNLPVDAFLVSDPGVLTLIKEELPEATIHLSTQASTTNAPAARFWQEQGAKRIVLAREMTLEEIRCLHQDLQEGKAGEEPLELEAFVHGAMCISYSGRCLLSNYMTGRDANRGECAHPCRWEYRLEEAKTPGDYYPVEEDHRGTYIMNSRDLAMIEHIPQLLDAGITSLKIEGRMKSAFYVANTVLAYRQAIDCYQEIRGEADDRIDWQVDPAWLHCLARTSHRPFSTGFYFGRPTSEGQNYETGDYIRSYAFTGVVLDYDEAGRVATVQQRNKMTIGEELEWFGPEGDCFCETLTAMEDEEGKPIRECPHPKQLVKIPVKRPAKKGMMICRRESADAEAE